MPQMNLKIVDISQFYKKEEEAVPKLYLREPTLEYIKEVLSEEDYIDFLEASTSPVYYEQVDLEIKEIVDGYFEGIKYQG